MKALVLKAYNQLEIQDVPLPRCGDGDVLVRIKAAAICGSDVHGMDGSSGRRIPPVVMGHEAAGVVEAVGSSVSGFKPGDRVTFDSTISCGYCRFCRRGEINLCDNRLVLGVSCGDYRLDGAFAEFVAVPERIVYRIGDGVTFEQAAMVEPLSVALHALRRSPTVTLNASVAVVGAGMIGLLVIQLLRAAGCGRIIAVDVADGKLAMAKKFGANACVRSDQTDAAKEIQALTGGGVDLAFEVVGVTPTLQIAVGSVRKGGSVTLVGNLKATAELPLQAAVTRQLTLNGTCASSGEYPDCLDLIASGKADVNSFISAVAPLEEGPSWFKRLYAAEPGLLKVILTP